MPTPAPLPTAVREVFVPGQITLDADLLAIRHGLARLFGMQLLSDLGDEDRGTAEIVLAEALNNIVEHACADLPGQIRVTVTRSDAGIFCVIRDRGRPMPGGALPAGHLAPMEAGGDLPEGGFGWFLIRRLARDVTYDRCDGENVLSFFLDAA